MHYLLVIKTTAKKNPKDYMKKNFPDPAVLLNKTDFPLNKKGK
jgi:hypothetical protein